MTQIEQKLQANLDIGNISTTAQHIQDKTRQDVQQIKLHCVHLVFYFLFLFFFRI